MKVIDNVSKFCMEIGKHYAYLDHGRKEVLFKVIERRRCPTTKCRHNNTPVCDGFRYEAEGDMAWCGVYTDFVPEEAPNESRY